MQSMAFMLHVFNRFTISSFLNGHNNVTLSFSAICLLDTFMLINNSSIKLIVYTGFRSKEKQGESILYGL